jgi:hypothetical protein
LENIELPYRLLLRGANLQQADISGATLANTDLRGTYLAGADLEGADLSGAFLRGANLSGANLGGANLKGARVTDGQLAENESLEGATMPDGTKHPSRQRVIGRNVCRGELRRTTLLPTWVDSSVTGWTLKSRRKLREEPGDRQ